MTSIPYLVLIMTCLAGLFWGASCEGAYSGNFLIENCNWRRRHFLNNLGAKVNVSIARFADHNLSRNLTCITNIYALEGYLRLKVSRFSLLGSSSCRTSSERLKIFHHGLQTNNYITWCGETYAEELYFKDTVVLEYNTGLHGEGDGFDIEVSRVGRPCGNVQTLAVTNKTRLLYSPLYPDPYPHRLDCYYRLLGPGKNLRIRSLSHDIEWDETCDYDVLQINQRKFCGSEIIDVHKTAQSTDTSVTFSTDGSYAGAGYVLEYFNEQDLSVVCDGDTSLNPIDLQGGENSHFIELKIKQTGRSTNCTLEIDAGSDDKVLDIKFPSRQDQIDCRKVFIQTTTHGNTSWQFTGCPRPFSYLRTSRRTFKIMVTATGIWRDYDIRFSVRPLVKDILPSSFFATTTTSFVWIDPQMIRSSSEYVTQIRKSANQKCIKVEAVSFDVGHFQEQGFGSSRPSLSFMPVSDWVTVHNGPNISCFDLTMGCRDSRSNASQIFNKESDVVTVLLNRRLEFTTGFWLSFKATDFCDWPVIQLSGRSGKFQPHPEWKMKNLFCTWELRKSPNFYPEGFRVKIDNNFSETSKNRFSVFEVGQNEVVKIADVHQDYGRNLWMYLDGGARLEVQILSASENLSPIIFDFDYEIVHSFPRQCGAYGLKALASPQLAHTVMYPNFFPRETNCTWIITKDPSVKSSSIVIDFPDFTCDSRMSLKVYTLPLLVSSYRWRLESRTPCFHTHQNRAAASQRYSAEALKIEFASLDAHPGFEFTYRRGGCVDATIDLTDFVDMSYLLHDKLPAEELFGRDCHFRVITEPSHKICVTFEELSLTSYSSSHCRENYFTIIGVGHNENSSLGMFCGAYAEKTSIFSLGNVIELTLHAEARTSLDIVYSITLKSIPPVTCPLTSIVHAGEYFQTLRYTFYPIAHDSSEKCKAWFIKNSDRSKYINVRVETNDFDTLTNGSCTGDHISVDEIDTITSEGSHIHLGTFCSYGYCSHSVNGSVGKSMIITFTVVPPLSGQDFIAYFKLRDPVQDRPESDGSSGSSDTKRIVGGTVGATGVLALGVIFCLWFAWMKKRKETRQANHERQNGTVSVTMNRQESSIYIVRPVIVDTFSSPPPYAAYANHEYDPELPPYPATEHDLSLTYQRQDSPPSYDLVDGADPPPYTEHGSNSHNGNPNQGGEVTSSVSAEQYDNVEVPRASASSNSEPIYELSSRVQYQGQENVYVEPTESSMDEPPEYEFVSPANNSSTMYDNYPPPPPYENLQNLIPMLPTRTRGHTRRGRLGPL